MLYCPDVHSAGAWDRIYEQNEDYARYMRDWTIAPLSRKEAIDANSRERFIAYFEKLQELRGKPLQGFSISVHTTAMRWWSRGRSSAWPRSGSSDDLQSPNSQRSIGNLQVKPGASESLEPTIFGGEFDIVTAFESLEHSINPLESLRRFHAALKHDSGLVDDHRAECRQFRACRALRTLAACRGWADRHRSYQFFWRRHISGRPAPCGL
jgi:hypothetical protein